MIFISLCIFIIIFGSGQPIYAIITSVIIALLIQILWSSAENKSVEKDRQEKLEQSLWRVDKRRK